MTTQNLIISIFSLINISLLLILFFSKKRIDTFETKNYSYLILITFLLPIVEISSYNVLKVTSKQITLAYICMSKFTLILYTSWILLFLFYMFLVTFNDKEKVNLSKKKLIAIFLTIYAIACMSILVTKIEYNNIEGLLIPSGMSTNIVYIISAISDAMLLILLFTNKNNFKNKKYFPIYILFFVGVGIMIFQYFNPEFFLLSSLLVYTTFIMYFTIENPDVKMLEKVEIARDVAEKANRAKSDFLSSMSHEIRTPLNAIVGFSEDIQSHKETCNPEIVEDADYIMEASKTLLEIIGNILDINKIEANKMEIVDIPYNFKEEISQLAKIDATRIGEKPIDFKVNIAEDIPYELYGDKIHMKEIVNNLLTNAIKYTDQGSIELIVKCINKDSICNLMISVKDTGKGIKADHINRLFTKFDRLDVEKNTITEGTGLGLAITKALVEMMGGKINVQSRFGVGSIFVVQIPQKISKISATTIVRENVVLQLNEKQPPVENDNRSVYKNKRVLIVDDNKLNIKVAKKALQDFDFEIDECYDGLECMEKVKIGNEYDLILMDIMMPNMSGESALKKLKENPNFNIPTIALTADAVSGAEEKYKGEGFVDYIAKPFKKEQIKEKLDTIFAISNL